MEVNQSPSQRRVEYDIRQRKMADTERDLCAKLIKGDDNDGNSDD